MIEGQKIGIFTSKSGKRVLIRAIKHDDVAIIMEHVNKISREDTYLLVSGEQFSKSQEELFVRNIVDHMLAGNYLYFLAFVDGKLAGTGTLRRMIENRKRTLHVGEIGLMISKDFREDGIGSLLLQNLIKESKKMKNIRLIRLWVFGSNEKAKKLYRKFGFEQCGSIPESILYRGQYISHDLMCLNSHQM